MWKKLFFLDRSQIESALTVGHNYGGKVCHFDLKISEKFGDRTQPKCSIHICQCYYLTKLSVTFRQWDNLVSKC